MKTLIAIPCMDMVFTDFMVSMLHLKKVDRCDVAIRKSSLIYDARNQLARQAIEGDYDRILWLDSDMTFEPDFMQRLSARLDEGLEYVSGIYFTRKAPVRPVLYSECGYFESKDGAIQPAAVWYDEYPKDTLFEVAATGFGGVMMTTDLIKRVAEKFGMPFAPMLGFGEDLSFCGRAQQVNGKMWVDSSIKMGHIGTGAITEEIYLQQKGDQNANTGCSENGPEGND